MKYENPFEHDAANNLSKDLILDIYIEDYNYTRFIQSARNVFLMGERGSGKSMTLLYNSLPFQMHKAERESREQSFEHVGIYVPCNTPLTHKQEYQLLEHDSLAAAFSEHFLVLSIAHAAASALEEAASAIGAIDHDALRSELEYIMGAKLPERSTIFESVKLLAEREVARAQRDAISSNPALVVERALTFSSLVLPLLNAFKRIEKLKSSHYMLMIDDAQDLNGHQRKTLNSWIAYRDRSVFSFKVAVANVAAADYTTRTGGLILEGHDFISIDMEKPYQSAESPYGKLARRIVEKRLKRVGLDISADEFFPQSEELRKELEVCNEEVRKEAMELYPKGTAKQINDHIYKYGRVRYFRKRAAKANLPPYSGFDTIAHVSTGVIRNLLDPCYWMYDRVYSDRAAEGMNTRVDQIPSKIQDAVIKERSEQLWNWMQTGLSNAVPGCTEVQARQVTKLFDNLAVLFRERLLRAKSEPRIIVFSISGATKEYEDKLMPLLDIARRAQLLYVRYGPSKDDGRREAYYVPNRLLWPIRALDPNGQYGRLSLKASDILAAADGIPFPFVEEASVASQGRLFE